MRITMTTFIDLKTVVKPSDKAGNVVVFHYKMR